MNVVNESKPIVAPNDIVRHKFEKASGIMKRRGSPKLRVVEFETHFEATEGSHRLFCAAMNGLPVCLEVVNGLRVTHDAVSIYQYRIESDKVVDYFNEFSYRYDINEWKRPVYRLNASISYRAKCAPVRNDRVLNDSRIQSARTYSNLPNPSEITGW